MSSTEVDFGGVLDLSSADTRGFEAAQSGTYDCELFEWKMVGTKDKPNSKLPAGTPMVKVQFKCIEDTYKGHFFDQFVIPPQDYDAEKRDKMLGALVRFLVAMGLEESKVKNKSFKLVDSLDGLVGEPVRVTVGREQTYGEDKDLPENEKTYQNPVKGYKRIGTGATSSGAGLL